MKLSRSRFLLAGVALCSVATTALAHHSFAGVFDVNKPVTVTGTIAKIEWINPHSYFYVDVKEKGETVRWAFESLPPSMFKHTGLKREMLPLGAEVTVNGYAAKDGTKALGWVKRFTFADGRVIQVTGDNPAEAEGK